MKIKHIKSIVLFVGCSLIFTSGIQNINLVNAQPAVAPAINNTIQTENLVNPLNIVNSPKFYLNKKVCLKAKFDKFSTLGLDYKPALKSSDDYISFLIKRNDTQHSIPLSEMKLFLKRDVAEKFIDLKSDDMVYIEGTVFSDALGDAWVDVSKLEVLNSNK